jgi:hypothetical protein
MATQPAATEPAAVQPAATTTSATAPAATAAAEPTEPPAPREFRPGEPCAAPLQCRLSFEPRHGSGLPSGTAGMLTRAGVAAAGCAAVCAFFVCKEHHWSAYRLMQPPVPIT